MARRGECLRWIHANIGHTGSACLKWPFSRRADGRPSSITIKSKSFAVCRVICELAHGKAPAESHQAAHTCGRAHEGCVNPTHLYWATPKENKADCFKHGTAPVGENNPRAVLTKHQVRQIRQLKSEMSYKEIARRFGISHHTVAKIQRRELWK